MCILYVYVQFNINVFLHVVLYYLILELLYQHSGHILYIYIYKVIFNNTQNLAFLVLTATIPSPTHMGVSTCDKWYRADAWHRTRRRRDVGGRSKFFTYCARLSMWNNTTYLTWIRFVYIMTLKCRVIYLYSAF